MSHRLTTPAEMGRWALVGSEPAGRFLLERWRLRGDFPLAATCPLNPTAAEAGPDVPLPRIDDWSQLLSDSFLTGVILTVSWEMRSGLIRSALAAGKRVLVEQSPGIWPDIVSLWEGIQNSPGRLGVFHVRRPAADFHAARAAIASGCMGTLRSLRWISCEYGLTAETAATGTQTGWINTLRTFGPECFDQLLALTPAAPILATAWSCPESAGFQARLEFPAGVFAWIDVQRAALCGLETGWVLEGTAGAYRQGKLITRADDGELLEEDIDLGASANDVDLMSELRRLAGDLPATHASLCRALLTGEILRAIETSAEQQRSIPISPQP